MVQRFVSFTNLLMLKTTLLFFATALCEIVGCYLPWLWLKRGATPLLLIPTAGAGAIRLAPDAPSGRQRAGIYRLRWGVRLYRIALAAGR